jgi:ABC-type Mn/Zn transport systems, ATPase component
MDNGESVLRMRGLTLGYNGNAVLTHVDLTVRAGEFWFLLGPNGSGKSTLLKSVLGLLQPLDGEIWLHPELRTRERIGFVPQHCEFNHSLPTTIREFVLLGLVGLKTNRKENSARLAWALEKVNLQGMARHDYWSLSGGQCQRVLVARALARRPSLLIMDEPTGGLDLAVETRLMECLGRLNREENITIFCVSHDLATAAHYASHVALVHDGSVEAGLLSEVLFPQNVERVYGMRMNLSLVASPARGPAAR